ACHSSQETRPGAEPREPPWAVARAASGAPRGGRPDRKGRAAPRKRGDCCGASRRSTPSLVRGAKWKEAQPARRDKRAAERWLSDNRETEAVMTGRYRACIEMLARSACISTSSASQGFGM